MGTHRQHLDLASERFGAAEQMYREGREHTAAHLYINAAINYHNAACQKFLGKIPSHKEHHDTSYFNELAKFLKDDLPRYREIYKELVSSKSQADYGLSLSLDSATRIRRQAQKLREIIEPLL